MLPLSTNWWMGLKCSKLPNCLVSHLFKLFQSDLISQTLLYTKTDLANFHWDHFWGLLQPLHWMHVFTIWLGSLFGSPATIALKARFHNREWLCRMDGMDRATKVEREEVRVAWGKTIAAGKIVQYFALAKSQYNVIMQYPGECNIMQIAPSFPCALIDSEQTARQTEADACLPRISIFVKISRYFEISNMSLLDIRKKPSGHRCVHS